MAFRSIHRADLQAPVLDVQAVWAVLRRGIERRERESLDLAMHEQLVLLNASTMRPKSNTPVEGLSPNWTICRKLTPVAGKPE
jgi:hypothetical protein